MKKVKIIAVDVSMKADARRMRWLLEGNGYFMEENYLCGHGRNTEAEKEQARKEIDEAMRED